MNRILVNSALIAGILSVLTIFATTGKGLVDGILKEWLSGCVIVFHQEIINDHQLLASVYSRGEMPSDLAISFIAQQPVVKTVTLQSSVRNNGRALHPLNSRFCPLESAADQEYGCTQVPPHSELGYNKVRFEKIDVDPNYNIEFIVEFTRGVALNLGLEHQIDLTKKMDSEGEEIGFLMLADSSTQAGNSCSVKQRHWTNYFVTLSTGWQLVWACLFILVISALTTILVKVKT